MISLLLLLAQTDQALPRDTLVNFSTVAPGVVVRWPPHRVYHTASGEFRDLESMAAEAAKADVVFFGEQHDDYVTHWMQLALLEAVDRRRDSVVLSLEMFERDVQPLLDRYLRYEVPEDSLLAGSRPWPKYAEHYRPMVEWARANAWPVIAANVPRRIASAIARGGLGVLDTLSSAERGFAADSIDCGRDRYFELFANTMREHVPGDTPEAKAASLDRYYFSQCIKDETMAEAIVGARNDSALIIHMNGAFHSDYALGTAQRVQRRRPDARIVVITGVPVADLDDIELPSDTSVAEWIVFTLKR
jgi:uncharacterized iron-regulated protein